jgi:hypothetical protein
MHRTQNPTASAADTDNGPVVTPATILRGAARYLEAHGWTQGDYYSDATSAFPAACADGAIAMAVYGRRHGDPFDAINPDRIYVNNAVDVLADYLTCTAALTDWDTGDLLPIEVPERNDRPEITAEQVITALDAAADDYDWAHASDDDLETYADACTWNETQPTREGFLAWRGTR